MASSDPASAMVYAARESRWEAYRPHQEWYSHEVFGIHGVGHSARVLVWANLIGLWMLEQGIAVDLESVSWSAALHDVRRENQGHDRLHGWRCAAWLRETSHGALAAIEAGCRARIGYCCAWHVAPDSDAPVMTPELVCLKDADSLDRVRLGCLNVRFLRTALAKALVKQAQFLCDHSETQADFRRDQWSAVRNTALRMGVWTPEPHAGCDAIRKRLRFFEC